MSTLLSRKDAASYLGVKPSTLAAWAHKQRYPLPLVRMGRRVLYNQADLDSFIAKNTIGVFQ